MWSNTGVSIVPPMSIEPVPSSIVPVEPQGAARAHWLLRLPPGSSLAMLAAAAVLVAVALAHGLQSLLGPAGQWSGPLAAGLGVLVVAVPLSVLLLKLARQAERQRERIDQIGRAADDGGVLDRAGFVALAEREWARVRRHGGGVAVLLIDVDRWRRLAESRDAAVAQALVRELARCAAQTLRGGDALARFGEGRLVACLAHADGIGSLDAAERIRERIESLEVAIDDLRLKATVSVGVAVMQPAHDSLTALLDDADAAAAAARQAGGNCVRAAPMGRDRLQAPGPSVGDRRAAGPRA
jgi:diguanylate cyclase (GGDEF)-like protein